MVKLKIIVKEPLELLVSLMEIVGIFLYVIVILAD